jgi:hypothetical protein
MIRRTPSTSTSGEEPVFGSVLGFAVDAVDAVEPLAGEDPAVADTDVVDVPPAALAATVQDGDADTAVVPPV